MSAYGNVNRRKAITHEERHMRRAIIQAREAQRRELDARDMRRGLSLADDAHTKSQLDGFGIADYAMPQFDNPTTEV